MLGDHACDALVAQLGERSAEGVVPGDIEAMVDAELDDGDVRFGEHWGVTSRGLGGGGVDRLHVELDVDTLSDENASSLEGLVPLQAEVTAVE